MKDLQLHMVNICMKSAEKEFVGTQLYLLQSLGAQKNVAVRRDDWVIDSILQLDSKKIVSFPPMKAL